MSIILTVYHWLSTFLAAYGPWMVTALLPSVIVGLSNMPNEKATKVARVLKTILGFLSILTHSDAPGTFKLPFKGVKKIAPVAILVLVLSGISCSWLTSTAGTPAGQAAILCVGSALITEAGNLINTVRAILTGGAPNWKAQLESLKALGQDALACAVGQVIVQLEAEAIPTKGEGMTASPDKLKVRAAAADGAEKAKLFLKEKNWNPKL